MLELLKQRPSSPIPFELQLLLVTFCGSGLIHLLEPRKVKLLISLSGAMFNYLYNKREFRNILWCLRFLDKESVYDILLLFIKFFFLKIHNLHTFLLME